MVKVLRNLVPPWMAVALTVACATTSSGEEFYKGKTLRLMPYTNAGSTHDILARIAAPFLKKYIPGNPTVIVQNMPGAGGVIVANYIARVARPDGLSVAILARGTPVLGLAKAPGVEYDARKFRWVLSPSRDVTVCLAFADAGFDSIKDVIGSDKRLIFSATGRAAGSFQIPAALNATLDSKIKIITGYRGSSGHQAAMERREVDGRCLSYYGTKVNPFLRDNLASGVLRILAQLPARHPDLPNVTLVNDLISKPEDLALINLIASPLNPWVAPPGTPEDRLDILRKAFFQAFQDPEFQRLAARAGFELNPMQGEEAEDLLQEMLQVPKETEQNVRKIMGG